MTVQHDTIDHLATLGIDKGALSLLARRAAANPEDDHFDAGTLDAKWLGISGFNPTVDLTTLPGWLKFTSGGAKMQPLPAGDWTIETEVILQEMLDTTPWNGCGLLLSSDLVQATRESIDLNIARDAGLGFRLVISNIVNGAWSSNAFEGGVSPALAHIFMRIRKVGGAYTFDIGETDKAFYRLYHAASLSFTPAYFGLESSIAGGMFNYFLRY